jgi:F-type H+-transporting ATPase subunit b
VGRLIGTGLVLGVPILCRAAEEGGHGEEPAGPLAALGLDFRTVFVQFLCFLVLFWLFKRFLWGPILSILDQRQTEVETMYRLAEEARDGAINARKEYEAKLARSQEEARQHINEAMKQATALKEEIVANARAESERIVAAGQEAVRQEAEKAMVALRDEVARLAVGAAGEIVRRNLDEDAHRALVDDFIAKAGSNS